MEKHTHRCSKAFASKLAPAKKSCDFLAWLLFASPMLQNALFFSQLKKKKKEVPKPGIEPGTFRSSV